MITRYTGTEQVKESGAEFRLGHRPALDGLRGIFVLLVLAVHSGVPFMQGASLGVDGFFALSGFLITTLLLQEWRQYGSINLKRFYIRRALRLLPALYVMLAVFSIITAIALAGDGAVATWRGLLLSGLYSSNLYTAIYSDYGMGTGLVNHTWSLALEEQFYLLWPILLIGLLRLRMSHNRLAVFIGGMVLLAPLSRVLILSPGHTVGLFYLGMYVRTDALLIGCALGAFAVGGFIMPSRKAAKVTRWLTVAGAGVLGYLIVNNFWISDLMSFYVIYALIGLSAGVFIFHLLVSPKGRLAQMLSWKPLSQLGVVSYGVYLWHNPVFQLLQPGPAGWLDLRVQFGRLVITVLLVLASYRLVEKPMLRLKERFAGKREVRVRPAVSGLGAQGESA